MSFAIATPVGGEPGRENSSYQITQLEEGIGFADVFSPPHLDAVIEHVTWRDTVIDANGCAAKPAEVALGLILVDPKLGRKLNRVIHRFMDIAHELQIAVGRQFVGTDH